MVQSSPDADRSVSGGFSAPRSLLRRLDALARVAYPDHRRMRSHLIQELLLSALPARFGERWEAIADAAMAEEHPAE